LAVEPVWDTQKTCLQQVSIPGRPDRNESLYQQLSIQTNAVFRILRAVES